MSLLARHPHLKFAELDRKANANFTPDDPYFGSEWHATKIGAPVAWDWTRGAGVTIAILDSGVDGSHPDSLRANGPGMEFLRQQLQYL
jgi:subtilisin family serine protease